MKLQALTCIALICLLSVGAVHAQDRASAWKGAGIDDKPVRFDPDNLHRPAILLFWATWCPYCKALMPYVQKVADAAGRDHLDVYAIDIKEDEGADPAAELRTRKLSFTLVRNGDPIADQYSVKGTPGLFLVDVQGNIVYKRVGGDAPGKVEAALRERLHLSSR